MDVTIHPSALVKVEFGPGPLAMVLEEAAAWQREHVEQAADDDIWCHSIHTEMDGEEYLVALIYCDDGNLLGMRAPR